MLCVFHFHFFMWRFMSHDSCSIISHIVFNFVTHRFLLRTSDLCTVCVNIIYFLCFINCFDLKKIVNDRLKICEIGIIILNLTNNIILTEIFENFYIIT